MNALTPPYSSSENSSDESSPHHPTSSHRFNRHTTQPRLISTTYHPPLLRQAVDTGDIILPEAKRPRSSNSNDRPFTGHSQPQQQSSSSSRHCLTPALTPEQIASSSLNLTQKAVARAQQANVTVPGSAGQNEKDRFVNGLVGASVLAIESIWGPSHPSTSSTRFTTPSTVLPLQYFVREVLRRSRTSCSTLQLSLYYLHKSRRQIREAVSCAEVAREEIKKLARGERDRIERKEWERIDEEWLMSSSSDEVKKSSSSSYPSPPESPASTSSPSTTIDQDSPSSSTTTESLGERFTRLLDTQKTPLLCGRRMFLASLISASKYLQDRNYSNQAWAKISGLSIEEINGNERRFLELIGWELHLDSEDFKVWTERLSTLTTSTPPTPMNVTSTESARQGLNRSSSEYLPPPPHVSTSTSTSTVHSNLARSKLALTRGNSAPQLEHCHASSSSSLTRKSSTVRGGGSSGFPIAKPINVKKNQKKEEEMGVVNQETGNGNGEVEKRKVRGLPMRRMNHSASTYERRNHVGESIRVH